jgi:hypothetical protein
LFPKLPPSPFPPSDDEPSGDEELSNQPPLSGSMLPAKPGDPDVAHEASVAKERIRNDPAV